VGGGQQGESTPAGSASELYPSRPARGWLRAVYRRGAGSEL